MKRKIPMTPSGIEPATFRLVEPQPIATPCAPYLEVLSRTSPSGIEENHKKPDESHENSKTEQQV